MRFSFSVPIHGVLASAVAARTPQPRCDDIQFPCGRWRCQLFCPNESLFGSLIRCSTAVNEGKPSIRMSATHESASAGRKKTSNLAFFIDEP